MVRVVMNITASQHYRFSRWGKGRGKVVRSQNWLEEGQPKQILPLYPTLPSQAGRPDTSLSGPVLTQAWAQIQVDKLGLL